MIKGDGSCALMMNEDGEIPADMGGDGRDSRVCEAGGKFILTNTV